MAVLKKYPWLFSGAAAIVLGYMLLAAGDVTAAPLLLVAGYCVMIPIFLLKSFLSRKGE